MPNVVFAQNNQMTKSCTPEAADIETWHRVSRYYRYWNMKCLQRRNLKLSSVCQVGALPFPVNCAFVESYQIVRNVPNSTKRTAPKCVDIWRHHVVPLCKGSFDWMFRYRGQPYSTDVIRGCFGEWLYPVELDLSCDDDFFVLFLSLFCVLKGALCNKWSPLHSHMHCSSICSSMSSSNVSHKKFYTP